MARSLSSRSAANAHARSPKKGKQEILAELGGGPNGAAIGPDGAASPHGAALDYKTGSIQRVDLKTGAVTTLYAGCDGRQLRGPNDLVFDRTGGFWFSDLGKGNGDSMQMGHAL